jgi:hypothetical protein
MPAPKHSKAQINNAIAAAKAAGLTPTAIRIGADGSLTIDISAGELNDAANVVHEKAPRKFGEARR